MSHPRSLGQIAFKPSTAAALARASSALKPSLLTALAPAYETGASERTAEEQAQLQSRFNEAGATIDAALRQAAEQEAAEQARAQAEAATPFYLKKYGPLPLWAWATGGVAAIGVGSLLLRRRRS